MRTLTSAAAVMAIIAGLLAAPSAALAADAPRRIARLTGEYPGIVTPEPDGTGNAVLRPYIAEAKICYRFTWERMQVRKLDVYRRSTGAMVAELYDENPTTSGELTGCSTTGRNDWYRLTSRRVREITRYPRRFYVVASTYGVEEIAGTLRRP